MMELLASSALGVLGLAVALVLARLADRAPTPRADLRQPGQLRAGGIDRYLRRHNVVVVASAGLLGGLMLLAYGVAHQTSLGASLPARAYGLWLVGSFFVGVAVTLASAWLAARADRRHCARVADAVQTGLDEALRLLVRSTAASALAGLALALLALVGLLALGLWLAGPDPAVRAQSLASVPHLLRPVGGLALGATFVALFAQLGGGLFAKVADIGADVGGKIEASLPEDAPDNPATLADLVGDAVGDHHAGAAAAVAGTLTLCAAAMLVAARVYQSNPELPSVSATVLFPLVVQAFGLLAACFGVLVVRTNDREGPLSAIARGYVVAALLHGLAIAGAAKWLLGDAWASWATCAALGTLGGLTSGALAHYYSDPRYRPVRALAEAARGGGALATLRGFASAVEGSAALVLLVGLLLFAAQKIGSSSGLVGGGLLGITIASLGLLSFAPLVVANDGVGAVADSSSGLVALTVGSNRPDAHARARLLDAAGSASKMLRGSLRAVGCAVTGWLVVSVLQLELWAHHASDSSRTIDVLAWAPYLGALGGLLVVATFGWAALARLLGGARGFLFELRALIADAPSSARSGSDGEWKDPQRCVESISRVALRGMLPPVLLGLGLPLGLGLALRMAATGDRVTTSSQAIVALLLAATSVGAVGALLFGTAGGAWDQAKKYIETGAHGGRYLQQNVGPIVTKRSEAIGPGVRDDGLVDNPAYVAVVIGDTIGDALKGLLAPATVALVHTLAMLALVFLPLFL